MTLDEILEKYLWDERSKKNMKVDILKWVEEEMSGTVFREEEEAEA